MSSRLFTEVRERRGLAYYVYAHNQSYTDAGSLFSQAGVDIARSEEAVETIVREFRRIAEEPVPAEELEKARALAKGRFVLRLENPQGMIVYGLARAVLGDPVLEPQEVLAGLDAVTAEDVQRVAQDVIGPQGLNLALIGPFEDKAPFEKLLASASAFGGLRDGPADLGVDGAVLVRSGADAEGRPLEAQSELLEVAVNLLDVLRDRRAHVSETDVLAYQQHVLLGNLANVDLEPRVLSLFGHGSSFLLGQGSVVRSRASSSRSSSSSIRSPSSPARAAKRSDSAAFPATACARASAS